MSSISDLITVVQNIEFNCSFCCSCCWFYIPKLVGDFFHVPPTRRSTGYKVSVNIFALTVPSSIKIDSKRVSEAKLPTPWSYLIHLLRDSGQIILSGDFASSTMKCTDFAFLLKQLYIAQ